MQLDGRRRAPRPPPPHERRTRQAPRRLVPSRPRPYLAFYRPSPSLTSLLLLTHSFFPSSTSCRPTSRAWSAAPAFRKSRPRSSSPRTAASEQLKMATTRTGSSRSRRRTTCSLSRKTRRSVRRLVLLVGRLVPRLVAKLTVALSPSTASPPCRSSARYMGRSESDGILDRRSVRALLRLLARLDWT